jgi:transcriptional regulator with XRE-family HTH domain
VREASFGRRLRAMRRQIGLTQTELAGADMSTSYISLLESGKRRPTADTLTRLAARLNTPVELLTGGEDLDGEDDDAERLDLCDAHLNLLSGEVEEAYETYQRLWKSPDVSSKALRESLLGLAWCTERRGDLQEACSRYTQWLGSADEAHDDFEIRINTVSRLCRCQRETGRVREAVTLAEQTLGELRDVGLDRTPSAVMLLLELVEMYRDQDLADPAERLAAGLPGLVATIGDMPAHRDAYRRASHAARDDGRPHLALGLARRALNTHRFGLQTALSAWLQAGPDIERLTAIRAGLDGLAGPADAARCDIELAEHLVAAGRTEEAAGRARAARDSLGEGFRLTRARATLVLARAQWAQAKAGAHANAEDHGPAAEATAAFAEAAAQFEQAGMVRIAARTYLELAAKLEETGQVPDALAMYRRAAGVMGV